MHRMLVDCTVVPGLSLLGMFFFCSGSRDVKKGTCHDSYSCILLTHVYCMPTSRRAQGRWSSCYQSRALTLTRFQVHRWTPQLLIPHQSNCLTLEEARYGSDAPLCLCVSSFAAFTHAHVCICKHTHTHAYTHTHTHTRARARMVYAAFFARWCAKSCGCCLSAGWLFGVHI